LETSCSIKEHTQTSTERGIGCRRNGYWLATNHLSGGANQGVLVCGRAVCRKGLCIN